LHRKVSHLVASSCFQQREVRADSGNLNSGISGVSATQPVVDVKSLHAKIGELTLENDFLEGALSKAGLLSARR
jgi:hypothetical protein